MIKFTLKSGEVIEYVKPFVCEDKYFIKTNVVRDGFSEGPWAWLHPEDKEKYEKNLSGKIILVISANQCLNGIPWGCIYPVKLQSNMRPECNMDILMDLQQTPQYWIPLFEDGIQELISSKTNLDQDSMNYYKKILGRDHPKCVELQNLIDNKQFN